MNFHLDATLPGFLLQHLTNLGMLIIFTVFLILFSIERIIPKYSIKEKKNNRTISNILLGICYRIILSPILISPMVIYITRDMEYRLYRPDWYSGIFAFLIDILILDLLNYSMHFIAHKVPLLWRFHAIHHLDTHLDVTTGFRQHFGEKFILLFMRLPIIFMLAIPYKTILVFEVVAFCFGIFHHNNINFSERIEKIVGRIIVMPSFHSIHHGRDQQYTDSNYGFIFSWWDRFFKTKSLDFRPKNEKFSNGLDHHNDFSFLKLIYLPFTRLPLKDWK